MLKQLTDYAVGRAEGQLLAFAWCVESFLNNPKDDEMFRHLRKIIAQINKEHEVRSSNG